MITITIFATRMNDVFRTSPQDSNPFESFWEVHHIDDLGFDARDRWDGLTLRSIFCGLGGCFSSNLQPYQVDGKWWKNNITSWDLLKNPLLHIQWFRELGMFFLPISKMTITTQDSSILLRFGDRKLNQLICIRTTRENLYPSRITLSTSTAARNPGTFFPSGNLFVSGRFLGGWISSKIAIFSKTRSSLTLMVGI